jgi:UDP-N-acetylmuramyl pentapeptide phosphotransferase/UDP-N-acetylglucosamine-1-phosphate transferase
LNFDVNLVGVLYPAGIGLLSSLLMGILVVVTTRWHGRFSLDASHGIQKLHVHPTPRVGGVPIMFGLMASVMASPQDLRDQLWPWLLSALPAFAFGLIEDLTKRVSVQARLLATMSSGVLAWLLTGYAITEVNVWGMDWLLQFTIVSVLFTAFAVSGVANSINIIDGLNGLASSMVIWGVLGVAVLAGSLGDTFLASACILILACVSGFFLVNWPLGKLFLGDGGAYLLGFLLAWACVLLVERNHSVSAFAALLFCAHPLMEVFYSIYRRKIRNQHPGHPDRLHFHSLFKRRVVQRFMPNSSLTLRNSVGGLLIGGLSLFPAILAQWVYSSTLYSFCAFVAFGVGYVIFYKSMLIKTRSVSLNESLKASDGSVL